MLHFGGYCALGTSHFGDAGLRDAAVLGHMAQPQGALGARGVGVAGPQPAG